jgi:hypothetical protein
MIVKEVVMKNRIRKIPKSFSWVDHRLVRQRYIESCSHEQSALYLFLVCVADARGLSYYADKSIMKQLNMNLNTLRQARSGLIKNNLIAWQEPIYQVLSLEPRIIPRGSGQLMSMAELLAGAAGGAR